MKFILCLLQQVVLYINLFTFQANNRDGYNNSEYYEFILFPREIVYVGYAGRQLVLLW